MNTIEKLGDDETFRQIVERSITSFTDDELTTIKGYSFYNCKELQEVSLPLVTEIPPYAFYYCSKLTAFDLSNIAKIGTHAFYSCGVTEMKGPLITSISGSAFSHCRSLTNVEFSKVTSIEGSAFYNCTSLLNGKFPKVTSIKRSAFSFCSSLSSLIVGTELDDETAICTLGSTDTIPSSIGAIYVPVELVDSYKTATNWSSFADKIQSYEVPVSCQSLTITAEDVPGYKTSTTVHYEAVCTYSIEGMMQTGTKTFKGTAKSDTFDKNPSKESSRQIEVSYTFLGQTATTTITQGVAVDRTIGVTTSGIATYGWVTADSTYNVNGYDAYMSDSKGKGSSQAVMKLTCTGYSELTLYIRSNAEGSYDYTIASKANVSNYPTSSDSADTLSHTKSKQNSGTALSNYTAVNYTGLTGNDTIYIVFVKDGSGDNGDDRGFVLIPRE